MTRTDRVLSIALFVFLSSVYFATSSGITCSNDGSHYALTRALAEEGRFTIESYDEYAEGNDIAIREGRLFSDRPPGTALVATALYEIGGWLPSPLVQLRSRHDPDNPRLLYVMLVPVWAGAGTVVLLYLLLRELHTPIFSALTTGLVFGLGTVNWKYGSALFSHALSAFLVMLSLYMVVRIARTAAAHWSLPLVLGFVASFSVLVEYSNLLLVAAVAVYLVLTAESSSLAGRSAYVAIFIAGGLLPAGFLALYNTICFGSPLALSYDYAVNYPWAGQFRQTFSFPIYRGLRALLMWGEGGGQCNPLCYNQGLFLLSPVLVLSLLGIPSYLRRARRESVLTLGLFLVYLGLFAKHRTFHGFTADGRYLTPFVAPWCIPLAFWIEHLMGWAHRPARQATAYLVLYGAFFLSLRNIVLHIGFSYNYELDLAQLGPVIASPGNWSYLLGQLFPNLGNLPLLWLAEVPVLVLGLGVAWTIGHFTGRQ